jgi:lipoteichoic acid synthase
MHALRRAARAGRRPLGSCVCVPVPWRGAASDVEVSFTFPPGARLRDACLHQIGRLRRRLTQSSERFRTIVGLTAAQFIASALSRTAIAVYVNGLFEIDPWKLIQSAGQDVTIATVAGALACLLISFAPRGGRLIVSVYRFFACFHCALLAINVPAVHWTGAPITLQWLYLADFLKSATSQESVFPVVSIRLLLLLILIALAPLWVTALATRLWRERRARLSLELLALLTFTACVPLSLSSLIQPAPLTDVTNNIDSPVVVFAGSLLSGSPRLPRGATTPFDADPIVPASPITQVTSGPERPNIIMVVLESVGAPATEANLGRLPTLGRLMRAGVTYPNAYAATASTTESLFSLLVSRYPRVGFVASTKASGGYVSLPQRLKRLGYRTAYFGVDLSYGGTGSFLRRMNMDETYDAAAMRCPSSFDHSNSTSSFDSCLFERVARWTRGRTPFFAMVWTNDTHFPYAAGETHGAPGTRRAYLGALQSTDAALGRFIGAMRTESADRNTVFIVVGDHGEAFGEHGRRVHSTTIFEEEVHVPLLIYDPHAAASRSDPRLARLLDLPPTILQLAGGTPEPGWKGIDLWSGSAAKRAFMYTTWRGVQAGFRQGATAYMLDYYTGRASKFDLRSDPGERRPLPVAERQRTQIEAILGGWLEADGR